MFRKLYSIKPAILIIFFALFLWSCGKSKNSNILTGTWQQQYQISQYINPYTQETMYDTLGGNSFLIEFKSDNTFFINGTKDGTYTLSGNTSFSLKPLGNPATFFYATYNIISNSNGLLKTRRDGNSGEQKQVQDPNNMGMFMYANIQYVFIEYNKE